MKICSKCGEEKPFSEFHKDKTKKSGFRYHCKSCQAEKDRQYNEANRGKIQEKNKRYYEANHEKVQDSKRKYRESNPEKVIESRRRYEEANPEYGKEYYKANIEKRKHYSRAWCKANPEKRRDYTNTKRATDIVFRLLGNIRKRTRQVLKSRLKSGSAVRDLGCDGQYLKDYLESLFTEGMTWENYGKREGQWSIDHIVPLTAFNIEDRQHFLLAHHYLNLRPMWHLENISKSDKLLWELAEAA